MKRDGLCTSLWQDGVPSHASGNPAGETVYDVVVVGGGITGITTALRLQKGGKRCLVAEAHNLCFGTTGGTTSHINTFMDTSYDIVISDFGEENAQLLARATKDAIALFETNVQAYGIDCGFARKDGYIYSQDDKQTTKLGKIFDASQQAGVEVEYTKLIPVPVPFDKAIVYRGQAQIHPTQYVLGLAKALEEEGGVILDNCHVLDAQNGDIIDVQTTRGMIRARHLIYATHIPPGINLLHFRCAPYRSYVMAVKLKGDNYPDALAYDMYDPYHYFRTHEVNGQRYLIAGGEDHKTAHEENTEACFLHLESHIRKFYEVEEISYKWSSQYFEPSDGLAYIGNLPGNPDNVWVATGFSGNGITYSHIAALTLSDLILKGDSAYGDLFNPNRVKPVAGFASFIKENVDVVKEFVTKRVKQEKLTDLSDLAKGEARVVKYEGESIALYKDDAGELHAVNPVCTHAKCIVGWNRAERSWDCPCHGARYSPQGEVLTGPARKGLERIEIEKLGEDVP